MNTELAEQLIIICALVMSYLHDTFVARWYGGSNECVDERFGMSVMAKGVNCGVFKWMKHEMFWTCDENEGK